MARVLLVAGLLLLTSGGWVLARPASDDLAPADQPISVRSGSVSGGGVAVSGARSSGVRGPRRHPGGGLHFGK